VELCYKKILFVESSCEVIF